jgi:hypothetical protein
MLHISKKNSEEYGKGKVDFDIKSYLLPEKLTIKWRL